MLLYLLKAELRKKMHYQPFQGQKKLIVNWRVSQYLKIK